MFSNNIPISRIIGIAVLGLTAMIFSFFIQEYSSEYHSGNIEDEEFIIIGLVLFAFVTGIGLVFQQKWARIILVVVMIGCLGLWFFAVLGRLNPRSHNSISAYGTTVFLVSFALSVALVLFNKKVGEEFGDKEELNPFEDTIDSQFFNN